MEKSKEEVPERLYGRVVKAQEQIDGLIAKGYKVITKTKNYSIVAKS